MDDLRRRLDETERRRSQGQQRIDELENRVFLLTDQIESAKVAANASVRARQERLPVVTLRPSEDQELDGLEAAPEVEFRGAARVHETERARPVLHLEGNLRKPKSIGTAASRPSDDSDGSDSLGVAPAPPIASAESTAPSLSASDRAPVRQADPVRIKDAPPRPAAEPLARYQAAYEVLRAGRPDEAAAMFREFVRLYPTHDYADNAQYWLGESYYTRQRYANAVPEFQTVFHRFPLGNKAPDAMLKLSYCLLAQGQGDKARGMLERVTTTYPRTDAARLASAKLAELGQGQGEGAQR